MPRTGRPRKFDEDTALDAAMRLFWLQGYEATSLDQLKRAMGGLSAASFYGAFGSKEKLYRRTMARYLACHGQGVASPLNDETLHPRNALETALRQSARLQSDPTLPRGCMLVLSALTTSPDNMHLQEFAAAERQCTRDVIRRCVDRGVARGELKHGAEADGLATLADAFVVGMSVQARDGVAPAALDVAVSTIMRLWDRLAPPPANVDGG